MHARAILVDDPMYLSFSYYLHRKEIETGMKCSKADLIIEMKCNVEGVLSILILWMFLFPSYYK